jgi:hypothetical protein
MRSLILVFALILISFNVFGLDVFADGQACQLATTSTCYRFQPKFSVKSYVAQLKFTTGRGVSTINGIDNDYTSYVINNDAPLILFFVENSLYNSCTNTTVVQKINKNINPRGWEVAQSDTDVNLTDAQVRDGAVAYLNKGELEDLLAYQCK